MATPQGDGSIILTTAIDQSGLKKGIGNIKSMAKTATKAFLAVGAAAATATIAIAKASVDAFAEYEQLVGGVETLFKDSAGKVLEYANEAFRTTGQSANEYMQNVTAFSASLLSAVGGDTEKAADIANAAMISISDNINKMGSSAESVQMAFQGFAKQQYMLLDNLKLGYGGTKTEMERLLKDAQAITGVEYNIDNLADVYTAIGVIQEKLGIAGTTAKEAATTISGSAATMKAAWQNVLTAISGGGDLDRAIENLVDSISNYFENIVPVVERALSGIGRLIEKVAPMLVQTVAKSLIKAIPSLLNAVYEMIIGLAKGIYQGIIDLFSGTSNDALTEQAQNIEQSVKNQDDLTESVKETNEELEKTTASFDTVEILSTEAAVETDFGAENKNVSNENINANITVTGEEEASEKASKISSVFDIINTTFEEIQQGITTNFAPTIDTIKKEFEDLGADATKAFEDIGQASTDVYQNSIAPLADRVANEFVPEIVNSTTENLAPIASDLAKIGIETFVETYKWAAEKIEQTNSDIVEPAMETLTKINTDAMDDIGSAWNEYGEAITQQMQNADDEARSLWDDLYEKVAKPIFEPLMEEIDKFWQEHLQPLWENLTKFFGSIIENALVLWNNVLSPILDIIISTFAPIIINLFNRMRDIFETVFGLLSDVISGALRSLTGLIDFITGVFTGDWEKAWKGIKEFVGGIWDTIWGIIKGVINLIIDGLNTLWRGVYSVFSGIANGIGSAVSWVGDLFGKDWGFSLPAEPPLIPKLAQGAVIPPNREFLAVLGDQKQGTNIETPLATMVEAFQMALDSRGGYSGGNTEVVLEIDGREFGRAVVEQGNRENRRIGTRLVIV